MSHFSFKRWSLNLIQFTLVSCGGSQDLIFEDRSNQAKTSGPIGFSEVSRSVFAPRCVSCHAGYSNYQTVRSDLSLILDSVSSNRMPKSGGALSDNQKEFLRSWAALGAPKDPAEPLPEPELPLEPTWKSLSVKIFIPRCQVCHNPEGQAKFLDLSTFAAILASKDRKYGDQVLLDTIDPEKSYLLTVITDPDEPMPPRRSNFPQLNQTELAAVTSWIQKSLPEE